MQRRRADCRRHAGVVDRQLAVERGQVRARIAHRAPQEHARIVHENVQPPEMRHGRLHQPDRLFAVRQVRLERLRAHPARRQLRRQRFRTLRRTAIAQRHIRPGPRQRPRNGRANPARRPSPARTRQIRHAYLALTRRADTFRLTVAPRGNLRDMPALETLMASSFSLGCRDPSPPRSSPRPRAAALHLADVRQLRARAARPRKSSVVHQRQHKRHNSRLISAARARAVNTLPTLPTSAPSPKATV